MKDEQSNRTDVKNLNIILSTSKDLKYIMPHSELNLHPSSFILFFKDAAPCDDAL